MRHLVANCDKFFDMYSALLEIVATDSGEDSSLLDTFEYLRISWHDILRLDEDIESAGYADHPLDSICLGILESRSFLFKYTTGEDEGSDKAGFIFVQQLCGFLGQVCHLEICFLSTP